MPDDSDMVRIYGNTYPVREKLKELGGVWDSREKVWKVPKAQEMVARFYVNNAPDKDTEEETYGT